MFGHVVTVDHFLADYYLQTQWRHRQALIMYLLCRLPPSWWGVRTQLLCFLTLSFTRQSPLEQHDSIATNMRVPAQVIPTASRLAGAGECVPGGGDAWSTAVTDSVPPCLGLAVAVDGHTQEIIPWRAREGNFRSWRT